MLWQDAVPGQYTVSITSGARVDNEISSRLVRKRRDVLETLPWLRYLPLKERVRLRIEWRLMIRTVEAL